MSWLLFNNFKRLQWVAKNHARVDLAIRLSYFLNESIHCHKARL